MGIRIDRGVILRGNSPKERDCISRRLLKNGIFVSLNRVPTNASDWASAPWEAQYLKLFDVTNSPNAGERNRPHSHAASPSATIPTRPAN